MSNNYELKNLHHIGRTELQARVCLDPTRRSLRRTVPTNAKRPNNINSRYILNRSEYNDIIKLLS